MEANSRMQRSHSAWDLRHLAVGAGAAVAACHIWAAPPAVCPATQSFKFPKKLPSD